jgi:uncharacterized membrane protein
LEGLRSQETVMTESDPRDDAPLSTSKRSDAVADATQHLADGKGSSIVARAVTINRPVGELFAYFRDFANLPTFMENVERIDVLDQCRSHWVVKGPAGKSYEWTSAITDEAQDSFIAWSSEDGADVPNSGRVEFRDAGARGTVVVATILYDPPGGVIGKLIAKMFQAVDGNRRDRDCGDEPQAA